jgi:hypothetical protein
MGWYKELQDSCKEFESKDVRRKTAKRLPRDHSSRLHYLHKRVKEFQTLQKGSKPLYNLCAAFDKWRRNDPNEYEGACNDFQTEVSDLRAKLPWPHDPKDIKIDCVFACGTGHDHYEYETLLFPCLYDDLIRAQTNLLKKTKKVNYKTGYTTPEKRLRQKAYLIDGIASKNEWEKRWLGKGKQSIGKAIIGKDLEGKAKRCVVNLKEDNPDIVVLVGHSRGSVICLEIAKRLNEEWKNEKSKHKIYLFIIDPVNMATKQGFKDGEKLEGCVEELNVMVMANVSESSDYPLTIPDSSKRIIHFMPGTHGTATQMHKDQVICRATYYWLLDWMDKIGVVTPKPKFESPTIAAVIPASEKYDKYQTFYFDKINDYNPWVVIDQRLGRAVYDYDKSDPEANFRSVGDRRKRRSSGQEAKRLSLLQKDDFSLLYHPIYINRHHYTLIKGNVALPREKPAKQATSTILDALDKRIRKRKWNKKANVLNENPHKNTKTTWSPEYRLRLYARQVTKK